MDEWVHLCCDASFPLAFRQSVSNRDRALWCSTQGSMVSSWIVWRTLMLMMLKYQMPSPSHRRKKTYSLMSNSLHLKPVQFYHIVKLLKEAQHVHFPWNPRHKLNIFKARKAIRILKNSGRSFSATSEITEVPMDVSQPCAEASGNIALYSDPQCHSCVRPVQSAVCELIYLSLGSFWQSYIPTLFPVFLNLGTWGHLPCPI